MIVEPIAGDDTAANLNPVGRIYYSASTMLLRAGVAVAGGWTGTGRAGGREAIERGAARGGLYAGAPRGGDAVQYGAGGAGVGAVN